MYYHTTIAVDGIEATRPYHQLTEDEAAILGQIIGFDGEDAVILDRAAIRNGSGTVVGEHLTIAADAWEVVCAQLTNTTT